MTSSTRRRTAASISILTAAVLAVPSLAAASGTSPGEPFDISEATMIGTAAETNSINGIDVSPVDGRVHAASVGGNEITIHDPDTGALVDRLGLDDGVSGPDDVYVTDDGTVYFTELLAGNVGRISPDGTVTTQFVGPGVNPITMSEDGRLFVGRIFLGQGLYELDPDLAADPVLLDETLVINAFDVGEDGFLYAPSFFTGEVLKIDVRTPGVLGDPTEVLGSDFGIISSVKLNSSGELHVAAIGDGIVYRFDPTTDEREVRLDIEGTIDNIAFGADDTLFVAAGVDNQLISVDTDGTVEVFGAPGLGLPGGVAVSADGTVWVADLFGMRGYDPGNRTASTTFYDRFAAPGTAFAGASTVAVDGDDLILSNAFSNSVQIIDPATGGITLDVRTLASPINALRHDGRVIAAQAGVPDVAAASVLDAETGDVVLDASMVDAPFFLPLGLASDGDTLYVSDWATGIVWSVSDAGVAPVTFDLAQPEGLAVDGDRLLVVEVGKQQVTAIDLATGEQSAAVVGMDLSAVATPGFLPFGAMSGVAVGPDGDIYVSDDGVNQVFRIDVPEVLPATGSAALWLLASGLGLLTVGVTVTRRRREA